MHLGPAICKGVKMDSTPGIKDDLRIKRRSIWTDEAVGEIDRHHVTSRRRPILPDFL